MIGKLRVTTDHVREVILLFSTITRNVPLEEFGSVCLQQVFIQCLILCDIFDLLHGIAIVNYLSRDNTA